MLFLLQAVQSLLKTSLSFPNVAFFTAVLPQGDGFGSCEACRSVMVHAGGARHAPAQPAQLIAADKDEAEAMWSPKQLVFELAVLLEQFVPERAAPFKTFRHFLKCLMERGRGFPQKTCRLLKALVLPYLLLKVLPPGIHLLQKLMSFSQEEIRRQIL